MLKQKLTPYLSVSPSRSSEYPFTYNSLYLQDPFANTDLSTVSEDVRDAIEAMRQAAESAETDLFNPQIDAATGADADALQAGKIKNKVLKLTGEVQVINIKV